MVIVSIGRSLVIRQVLLSGLVFALGVFAYAAAGHVETVARDLALSDPRTGTAALVLAAQTAAWHILLATIVVAVLMVVASIMLFQSAVVRPVRALADTIDGLANGGRSVILAGDSRSDEIGVMVRGLHRIRDSLVALDSLTAAAPNPAGSRQSQAAQTSVKIGQFAVDMAAHVRQLGTLTKRLSHASEMMIVAAKHASDGSDQATSASSDAAGDVSSVATASEQLLDSIEEISRQVVQSTSVVKAAVERAVETNAGMGRLSTAAQKVGDVVSLISRIAAQTNLLALNATIEAARAGEAGRGFAVVAQEVKTLATQTAKATQDITGQIAEMQEATELSVDAIDKIQKKISEVEHISTIIAAAVHEQGAATQEIARNVRSAAAGTATMSSHVENIVRSVDETSSSATAVAALAREFDQIAVTMTGMVDGMDDFVRALVAA